MQMREGQILAAERAFAKSLTFADRSGDPREMLATRWMLAMSIALGPAPVPECIDRCQELATARGTEHIGVLTELAILAAMVGRFDEARELNERARRTFVERWRVRRMLMFVARSTAAVEMLAGQTASAERELREGLEFARGTNELDHISQTAAQLSLLLRYDGRGDEADSLAAVSAQAAPSGGVAAQALSHAATARVASDAGDDVTALRLAGHAVRLAPAEMPNLRGDILIQLAVVLRASGHERRARDAESEAANLHQRKARTITAAHTILDGGY